MKTQIRLILAAAAVGVAGCAAGPIRVPHRISPAAEVPQTPPPATQPSKAEISLAQIEPAVMPPAKVVGDTPPLQAVELYAQARIALLDHRPANAIALLEQAVKVDPESYRLRSELGRLYLAGRRADDRAITTLEKASDLEPDHLDLQIDLGRQYLVKGDADRAIRHFRLAILSDEYAKDPGEAALAEYFLGGTLRPSGYETAALEVDQRLLSHLKFIAENKERYPGAATLLEHKEGLEAEVAELLVKHGRGAEAVSMCADLIAAEPTNFETRKRLVNVLVKLGRNNEAVTTAEDAAIHFHGDAASVNLLNFACAAAGDSGGAAGRLKSLHEAYPNDSTILYALVDLLENIGKNDDAERILEAADGRTSGDFEITRRRFELAMQRGARDVAVRLLLDETAKQPEIASLQAPLWGRLVRPTSHGRLRYLDLQAMIVPKELESAKEFWVARLAAFDRRRDIQLTALRRSAEGKPVFVTAFRDLLDEIWSQDDLEEAQQIAESNALADRAASVSNDGLELEIRGLALLREGKAALAEKPLEEAVAKARYPDRRFALAQVQREAGDDAAADSVLWGLVSDYPGFAAAYQDLYFSSVRRDLEGQAERVVTVWLAADPRGVEPRRIQAIQYVRAGRLDPAIEILNRVFNEGAADEETLSAMRSLYARAQRSEIFTEMLETRHAKDPGDFAVTSALVAAYAADHREDAAAGILDSAVTAAANDADLLCSIAGVYQIIGKKDKSEECLATVLKLEPGHPGASNDLGFAWADAGKNLVQAQAMISKALEAEPHSVAVLDSMAWVDYKRGAYADALQYINQALHPADAGKKLKADPMLADHRGDIQYRLGDKAAAIENWQKASDLIGAMGDDAAPDYKHCRESAMEKIRCIKAGEPVPAAPVAEAAEGVKSP